MYNSFLTPKAKRLYSNRLFWLALPLIIAFWWIIAAFVDKIAQLLDNEELYLLAGAINERGMGVFNANQPLMLLFLMLAGILLVRFGKAATTHTEFRFRTWMVVHPAHLMRQLDLVLTRLCEGRSDAAAQHRRLSGWIIVLAITLPIYAMIVIFPLYKIADNYQHFDLYVNIANIVRYALLFSWLMVFWRLFSLLPRTWRMPIARQPDPDANQRKDLLKTIASLRNNGLHALLLTTLLSYAFSVWAINLYVPMTTSELFKLTVGNDLGQTWPVVIGKFSFWFFMLALLLLTAQLYRMPSLVLKRNEKESWLHYVFYYFPIVQLVWRVFWPIRMQRQWREAMQIGEFVRPSTLGDGVVYTLAFTQLFFMSFTFYYILPLDEIAIRELGGWAYDLLISIRYTLYLPLELCFFASLIAVVYGMADNCEAAADELEHSYGLAPTAGGGELAVQQGTTETSQ